LIFCECFQLNIISGHLTQNFYLCNIPSFYQILELKNLFCLCWLKNHRELKLFEFNFKLYYKNYFKTFYYSLKNSLRNGVSKYYLVFIPTLCKLSCKGNIYKMIHIKESMHYQHGFENEFQNIIKYFPWFQRITLKILTLFSIMQIKSFFSIGKFFLKTSFIMRTCPCCLALIFWILENFTSWFDLIWNQNGFRKFLN
jgi:hypothetical protein